MDSSVLVVVAVMGIGFSILVAIAVVVYIQNKKKDPFEGLPTTPPPLDQIIPAHLRSPIKDEMAQRILNRMFSIRSTCWHINHFHRVEGPQILKTVLQKGAGDVQALERELTNVGIQVYEKCPADAVLTDGTREIKVREALARMKEGSPSFV